jgi:hypothetical protein
VSTVIGLTRAAGIHAFRTASTTAASTAPPTSRPRAFSLSGITFRTGVLGCLRIAGRPHIVQPRTEAVLGIESGGVVIPCGAFNRGCASFTISRLLPAGRLPLPPTVSPFSVASVVPVADGILSWLTITFPPSPAASAPPSPASTPILRIAGGLLFLTRAVARIQRSGWLGCFAILTATGRLVHEPGTESTE